MNSNERLKIGASRREVLSKTPSLSLRLRVVRVRGNTQRAPNKHPPCWSPGGYLTSTGRRHPRPEIVT
jgi:hypothetical protein